MLHITDSSRSFINQQQQQKNYVSWKVNKVKTTVLFDFSVSDFLHQNPNTEIWLVNH